MTNLKREKTMRLSKVTIDREKLMQALKSLKCCYGHESYPGCQALKRYTTTSAVTQTGFKLSNSDLVTQTGTDTNLESLEQLSALVIKDKP